MRVKFRYNGIRYHMIIPKMAKDQIIAYLKNLIDGITAVPCENNPVIISTHNHVLPYVIESDKALSNQAS